MTLYDETLTLLQELIRNACVNDLTPDSGQEIRNAESLERFFEGTPNVKITKLEPHPGRTSIIVTVPGSDPDAEPLTLLGHTDVVPVDLPKWTKDSFGAEISDGQIWGRGSVDMLFITATQAAVTRQVAREGGLRGTLTFVGVADEEARGGLGAKWLSEEHQNLFSWKNCLSESGGSHLPVHDGSDAVVINVGEKGAAQRRIHVNGDAGHGSIPFDRDSAIVKIGEVARRIAAADLKVAKDDIWQGFVQAHRFDPETEQALLSGTSPEAYAEFGGLSRFAHAVSHLTIAQTVVRAGQAINVLPSHAYLELDIRTLPGQTNDYVDDTLRAALGDLADEVEIEHLISEEATVSPTDSRLYNTLEKVLGDFFPDAPVVPIISSGGSDLRFGRRLGGVGYGFAVHARERTLAEAMGQLHSHDEALYLEDLELTVRGYDSVVREFLG
ncbi:M20/M25/M40 family metallo-hydrolase [Corynebacterium glutamicum]|uniref:M20/M25/M40 family metallo-hydrolase n=1 Tax=Corynebacterium glutamicum TaxID=1718 RepID=UPI000259C4D6|nr:M20/M25/M40 family metallo-hydrolase [Corynebacterium glutamicum]CCH25950.1 putative peptidase [Corynebacterium glutamicum K051]